MMSDKTNNKDVKILIKSHPFYIVDPSFISIAVSAFASIVAYKLVNYFHTGQPFHIDFFAFFSTLSLWFFIIMLEGKEPNIYTKAVRENYIFGVLLFIISEVMIFFAFFWTYLHSSLNPSVYIGGVWPPFNMKPMNAFHWPLFNTVILLLSGLTVNVFYYTMKSTDLPKITKGNIRVMKDQALSLTSNSVEFIFSYENKSDSKTNMYTHYPNNAFLVSPKNEELNNHFYRNWSNIVWSYAKACRFMRVHIAWITRLIYTSLSYTIFLGAIFIYCQYHEYMHASFDMTDGIYGSIFYSLTGLHGAHVIIGVCLLIAVLFRFAKKRGDFDYTFNPHEGVTASVWYWHFVDLIWIFVYFIVYLWGNSI